MVRRCATLGSLLAIILTLGFVLAQASTPKASSASTDFSTPWVPGSPSAFQCAVEWKATTTEWSFTAETTESAAAILVQLSLADSTATAIPPPALRTFPPLHHRPPPANS